MAGEEIIHVIDDDPMIRGALGSLFRSVGLQYKAYASGPEFLDASVPTTGGCLLLDIRLPGINGFDLHLEIARRGIRLPVVFMTGHGDIPMSVRGMKAGAVDFLPKPFRDQDLLDAVNLALATGRQRRQEDGRLQDLRGRFALLSDRQREVVELVAAGRMNKEVAHALGLSEVSIKRYRGQAMRKMGARSFADLVKDMAQIQGRDV
jgi:FixJ family two-component response regulator